MSPQNKLKISPWYYVNWFAVYLLAGLYLDIKGDLTKNDKCQIAKTESVSIVLIA